MASLVRAFSTVGANTLLSRISGFVRDMLVARLFGADAAVDAFLIAFKIPNFLRRLFGEGAFSMAFVPVLGEYKAQRSLAELRRFIDDVAGTLGGVLLLVTALGIWGAPFWVSLFAPGFRADPEKFALASDMLRLTFPYILFISLTAFAGGILNTHRRFGIPAFTPVLLNLSLMGGALWLSPHLERPIMALAWGVLIAGILQLGFQLPFLHQIRLLPRPRFNPRDEGVRRVIGLIIPALFGVSVTQINLLVDSLFSSFLPTGSITWLYYSDRLMEFPVGVLGAALGTVILPSLSRDHASQNPSAFNRTLDWGLRWVALMGLPAAVGLGVLAGPLLAVFFHAGAFTGQDVVMSARSLMAYALGLPAFLLIKVLAPGFYARQDTRTPVRIAVVTLVVNMLLNLALFRPLGHVGLALSTSLAAWLNAGLLYGQLRKTGIYHPLASGRMTLQGLIAALLMGGILWWGSGDWLQWLAQAGLIRTLHLVGWIVLGGGVYFGILALMGIRPRDLGSP
ncbi:MAG: murein biosynthesis integral membrane protein MurJ [Pseudomonadota bacterium]